jgi:hypothetical protein
LEAWDSAKELHGILSAGEIPPRPTQQLFQTGNVVAQQDSRSSRALLDVTDGLIRCAYGIQGPVANVLNLQKITPGA